MLGLSTYRLSFTCLGLPVGVMSVDIPRVTDVMVRLKNGSAKGSRRLLASYGLTVVKGALVRLWSGMKARLRREEKKKLWPYVRGKI